MVCPVSPQRKRQRYSRSADEGIVDVVLGLQASAALPAGYVVQVARIDAGLSVGALLHRQVVIKPLVLEEPVLNLTSDPDGPWNFENPQSKVSACSVPLGPFRA